MRASEASDFRNLRIENAVDAEDAASCCASIEFLCHRAIENDETMCVPMAISEFSLADLIGQPRLLERIVRTDGRVEFRYGLSGPLHPHH